VPLIVGVCRQLSDRNSNQKHLLGCILGSYVAIKAEIKGVKGVIKINGDFKDFDIFKNFFI
jgi:hypothetical protein